LNIVTAIACIRACTRPAFSRHSPNSLYIMFFDKALSTIISRQSSKNRLTSTIIKSAYLAFSFPKTIPRDAVIV